MPSGEPLLDQLWQNGHPVARQLWQAICTCVQAHRAKQDKQGELWQELDSTGGALQANAHDTLNAVAKMLKELSEQRKSFLTAMLAVLQVALGQCCSSKQLQYECSSAGKELWILCGKQSYA